PAPIAMRTSTAAAWVTASSDLAYAVGALREAARAAMPGSMSHPRTVQPARAAAIAMEVPINPVPTIATRSIGRPAEGSGVGIEVIAKSFRSVEVHVDHLSEPSLRVEEHEDPYDGRHRASDGHLACAEQGNHAKSDPPSRFGGERGAEVFGRREEDAHEVVGGHLVPFDHLLEEALGRPQHVLVAIGRDDDGPPGGTHPHARSFLDLEGGRRPGHPAPEGIRLHAGSWRPRTVIGGSRGAALPLGRGSLEFEQLLGRELATLARLQSTEADRADADPDQPGDRESDRSQQPSHLSFASFGHHDGDLTAAVTGVDEPDGPRTGGAVVEHHPR